MNQQDRTFLEQFLRSVERDFTIFTLPQSLCSELGRANRFYKKRFSKFGHTIELDLNYFDQALSILRALAQNTHFADSIPDDHELWNILHRLLTKPQATQKNKAEESLAFHDYTVADIARAQTLLKQLVKTSYDRSDELLIVKNLRLIQIKQRRQRRVKRQRSSLIMRDVDFLVFYLLSHSLPGSEFFDRHTIVALSKEVYQRRKKQCKADPKRTLRHGQKPTLGHPYHYRINEKSSISATLKRSSLKLCQCSALSPLPKKV